MGIVGDIEFYFVWCMDVFVVVFQFYVEVDVVVNVVVVLGVIYVGFRYMQCFRIGMIGFEVGFNQLTLDFRQIVFLCVKYRQMLGVSDFGVEIKFMCDMIYCYQFFWGDFIVWRMWDYRVGVVFLDVSEEVVVRILQWSMFWFQNVFVLVGGQQ